MSYFTPPPAPHSLTVPTQSNHDVWRIPLCLEHLAPLPFYRAVALWGLKKGEFFSRNDIAAVFHVSLRRASGVLEYLSKRADIDVQLEKDLRLLGAGRRQLWLRITAVDGATSLPQKLPRTAGRSRGRVSVAIPRRGGDDAFSLLKTFIFSHRLGTPLPEAVKSPPERAE